jgi:HEAT repeat protein
MAVDPAEGDAAGGLSEMGRKGIEEKRRPIVCPVLFFFLCLFAVNAFSQDLESLEHIIRSGNSEQKRTALYEIKKLANESMSRIAVPALSDPDVMVRSTAATAVVFLPPGEAVSVLLPLLNDKQEFVRREAAFALGEVGSSAAIAALLRVAQNDKIVEVRDAAVVALGMIGDISSIRTLTAILKKKPNEDAEFLRRSAARSIGQIASLIQNGNTRTLTPQNFLPEKYKEGKNASFRDLTSQGSDLSETSAEFQNALKTLLAVLDSSSESADARREAAFAAGMIGSDSAIPTLTKCSADSDPYLAEICKEALMKLR